MLNIQQGLESVHSALENGASQIQAISRLEQGLLAEYRQLRAERFQQMAVNLVLSMLRKDRSTAMKLIHENVKMFDKMAENVNYAMSNISATLVDEVRKGWPNFHWTPKEQSALVAQVTMGDKTLMTTGEKEWRGFDGEQAVHFLLSLKKLDWAKKAQPGILRNVSQIVEPLVEDPLLDALLYSGKSLTITKQYGMLSYKSLWRVTGKLATAKEFHLKGAGQAAVERLRKQIRDAEEGTDRKYGQEYLESRPLAGNAYIEDMQERLNEQIAKMDGREIAFETCAWR